uniref:Signal peptide peptidase-like 2B n=1 Tax=Globodera rostochiensis TaxID=31243 RepID=A0A914GV77_GLORO
MMFNNYAFCSILFVLLTISSPTEAFFKYDSSYAFLNVRSKSLPPEGLDFCVNFQQWRSRQLPLSADTKEFVQIGWWNRSLNTDICVENAHNFAKNELLPVDYRTKLGEVSACKFYRKKETAINGTINRLAAKGVRNVLFLMEKGKTNAYSTRDFLYSYFYNAEINDSDTSESVFYVYNETFHRQIEPLLLNSSSSPAELRFFRPDALFPMDPAVAVIWLFAVVSILIGSLWEASELKAKFARTKPLAIVVAEATGPGRSILRCRNSDTGRFVALRHTSEEEGQTQQNDELPVGPSQANEPIKTPLKRSPSQEFARMSVYQHLSVVLTVLVFVVVVLTLSYFFREYAVRGFCVLFWVFGIYSIHHCVYTFLKMFLNERPLPSLRECCGGGSKRVLSQSNSADGAEGNEPEMPTNIVTSPQTAVPACPPPPTTEPPIVSSTCPSSKKRFSLFDLPIKPMSSLVFALAVLFCTVWFIYREHYNAFYLLNTINIMVCIHSVKNSQCRSLRLLTFLMLAMFIYDLFMVFGTTLLTPDGCSVMMQVVTGVDCQRKRTGKRAQPVARIDQREVPEKIPLLFTVPMLGDPVGRCFDLEVELDYKYVLLGLGDVVIPGWLVAFCFYVDVVKRSRFYTYGTISMIGYSLGMVSTFVALLLMETGQPALIYLVPFTLGPIFAWAFFVDGNGILGKMWRGELQS